MIDDPFVLVLDVFLLSRLIVGLVCKLQFTFTIFFGKAKFAILQNALVSQSMLGRRRDCMNRLWLLEEGLV